MMDEAKPTVETIRDIVSRELRDQDAGAARDLQPLPRFNMDVSGVSGFLKLYYGVRCDCSTAAVLSVEVSREKTICEIEEAAPSLVSRLLAQRRAFQAMPCSAHERMRKGPFSALTESQPERPNAEA